MLGILSLIALLLQYLALSDIAKQEADASLEWRIVGIGMLIQLAFVTSTLATLLALRKRCSIIFRGSLQPDAGERS